MKILDRILACIVILGSFGHSAGSVLAYKHEPVTLLWALSTSMLWQLIAAINVLRTFRPDDRPLAWIAFAWSVAMAISALIFGVLIGNVFDLRAVVNVFVSLGLAAFSLKTAMRATRTQA
jgi:hypothetical protein